MDEFYYRAILTIFLVFNVVVRKRFDFGRETQDVRNPRASIAGFGVPLVLGLAPVCGLQLAGIDPLRITLGFVEGSVIRSLGLVLMLVATVAFLWPRVMQERRYAWADPATSREDIVNHQLVTHGPYRFVRHPFYASVVIGYFAIQLVFASWWVLLSPLIAWPIIRTIRAEEEQLLEDYPQEYVAYMKHTWRMIPFVY